MEGNDLLGLMAFLFMVPPMVVALIVGLKTAMKKN
jgi:hypothetical protein